MQCISECGRQRVRRTGVYVSVVLKTVLDAGLRLTIFSNTIRLIDRHHITVVDCETAEAMGQHDERHALYQDLIE
jgi:hypothetical protein